LVWGGEFCRRLDRIGERSQRIVLCLPDSSVVRTVLRELTPALDSESLIIDTTTGDPGQMEQIGADLAAHGMCYVDATVGGSSAQARRGEVIVMAGGGPADVDEARPILDTFATRVFHMGPCGSGARMKLVMNLVLGLNRAVLAEGLAFAEACGLEGEATLKVLQASPAHSAVMETKGRRMLLGNYEPEARLAQHLKDVRLILKAASRRGLRLPVSELHEELLNSLVERGFGGLDNSVVRRAFGPDGD
jgi:2-hydroxy-3-oxopropionate reductase